MTTTLVVLLMILDIGLLVAAFYLGRRKIDSSSLIMELTEERRYLTELRAAVQEELENARSKSQEFLRKMTQVATEAEQEVKSGSSTLAKEMEGVVNKLSVKFEDPLKELTKRQAAFEALLRRAEQDKLLLLKAIDRAEKLSKFFDKKIPYEDVLKEIQDKKYQDAHQLLAKGLGHAAVAKELGLSLSEVQLLIGLST